MKNIKEYIEENLLDTFKTIREFTNLQADVTAKAEELKNENALKRYAQEAYKKYITNANAKTFDAWWEGFYPALERYNKD